MSRSNILAVDAMGGDFAPEAIIAGLELAAVRQPHAKFLLFGDEARVAPLLAKTKRLKNQADFAPCERCHPGRYEANGGTAHA